jgi:hypothetical protein
MTQDEIIEMAKEARIHRDDSWRFEMLQEKNALEVFAKLVAAKAFQNGYEKGIAAFNDAVLLEREACAKLCDSFYESWINIHGRYEFMGEGAQECAAAIRARVKA